MYGRIILIVEVREENFVGGWLGVHSSKMSLSTRQKKQNRCHQTRLGGTKYIKLENVTIAMHCNLRPPDAAPAVLRTTPIGRSRTTYPFTIYNVFYCWYLILRCDLELLILWPWTSMVYWMWRDQTVPNFSEMEQYAAEL